MRKLKRVMAATLGFFLLTGAANTPNGGEIRKVDFTPGKDRSLLIVHYNGSGRFRVFQSEKQSNVIIEAENLRLPAALTKIIDASTSDGPVIQLTPYSSGDAKKAVSKFVLQLKGKATVTSSELPGKFVLELKRNSLVEESLARKNKKIPTLTKNGWSERDVLKSRDSANEKSEEVAKKLVEVLNAPPEEKAYFGSRVTFEGSEVEVHDIFRLVGEASGLNIITDADVNYKSNYSLNYIPWDQLLDIVISQAQLKATVSGNVVRIVTLKRFTEEQESKLREIDIADEMEPVVMAIIPLSFAKADEMKKMIETLLIKRDKSGVRGSAASGAAADGSGVTATDTKIATPAAPSAEGSAPADIKFIQDFVRGEIQVDERSNSLVITNTKDAIARIKKLVTELDVALPQVLIDAKIIIATESFSKTLGVSWGGRAASTGTGRAGLAGGFNSVGAMSLGDDPSPAFSVSPSDGAGAIGFNVGAGRHGNLTAQLSLAETDGISKTVASPRVIVNNKKQAVITDGQTIFLPTPAGPNAAGSLKEVKAALNLTVTPQVTSAGSVLLDLNITKDALERGGSVSNKTMQTQVLVDSGSTLVLGGVYQFTQGKDVNGIPLLKDLPFLGQLFRTDSETKSKNELMIFVTPQILEVGQKVSNIPAEPVGM